MNFRRVLFVILFTPILLVWSCRSKGDHENKLPSGAIGEADTDSSDTSISIHEASLNGDLDQVSGLISKGLDINIKDDDARTALMYAAYNGHTEVVRRLLAKGALVNLSDTNGRTALMLASSGPFPDAVKLLLDHGADPNMTDKEEHFTALMYAAAEGQLDVVKILLANRANPALRDADGDNARTFALNNGHKEIAALLNSFEK